MRSSFVSNVLLLFCLTTSSSLTAVVKREAPLPNQPSQSHLSAPGGFGRTGFGSETFGGRNVEGGYDTSLLSPFGNFDTPSKSASIGNGAYNGGLDFEDFGSAGGDSFKPISNDWPSAINYGTPATPSKPLPPPQAYGPPGHSSPSPPQIYGPPPPSYGILPRPLIQQDVPIRPSQPYDFPITPSTEYGAPLRPSQGYEVPNRSFLPNGAIATLPSVNSVAASNYAAPPASTGSGPYIGSSSGQFENGGRYSRGDSSWGNIESLNGRNSPRGTSNGFSAPSQSSRAPSAKQSYTNNNGCSL